MTDAARPDDGSATELTLHVANLNEEAALAIVRARIAGGENPYTIVEECRRGLNIVGERYETREYYLSALIMAGEIFLGIMLMLEPVITEQYQGNELGTILLGTVQGDIHSIGKNILGMLLSSYGFTVLDLGTDVSPEEFLEQAAATSPDIIALSGLLTSSYESMKDTVGLIRSKGTGRLLRTPIIIGGSTVDAQICRYVGANDWANDAMMGVRLFKKLLEEKQT